VLQKETQQYRFSRAERFAPSPSTTAGPFTPQPGVASLPIAQKLPTTLSARAIRDARREPVCSAEYTFGRAQDSLSWGNVLY